MSSDHLGALIRAVTVTTETTEQQVRAHERPTAIKLHQHRMSRHTDDHTPILGLPPEWTREAACLDDWKAWDEAETNPSLAHQLCAACPVRDLCLSAALAEEGMVSARERAGVRGGLTPWERYRLARGDVKCPKGLHEMTPENTMASSSGSRCRACGVVKAKGRWKVVSSCKMSCLGCGRELTLGNFPRHKRHSCKGERSAA